MLINNPGICSDILLPQTLQTYTENLRKKKKKKYLYETATSQSLIDSEQMKPDKILIKTTVVCFLYPTAMRLVSWFKKKKNILGYSMS